MTEEQLQRANDLKRVIHYTQEHAESVRRKDGFAPTVYGVQTMILANLIDWEAYFKRLDEYIANLQKEFEGM